jgi:hypothetical protein
MVKENTEEFIKINVKQEILIRHNVNVLEYYLLKEIERISKTDNNTSAKFINQCYPSVFATKRITRTLLDKLKDDGYLDKIEDRDLISQHTFSYTLTKSGYNVINDIVYKPKYSIEDYIKAMQVFSAWNDIKECSTHGIKQYGEIQSKTVATAMKYIIDLLHGGKLKWMGDEDIGKFSIAEIVSVVEEYAIKFQKEYIPEDKKVLPTALPSFFCHYKTGNSEFLHVCVNGVKKRETTMDLLKDTGITPSLLKKAYSVLSATGSATEAEKLDIQKNIIRTFKKWATQREVLLDDLYSWKKIYREKIMDFNMFLYEYLPYITAQVGEGNAKTGYLSFNQRNKILESYSAHLATKYNIFIFPTAKQIEQILNSKIVK